MQVLGIDIGGSGIKGAIVNTHTGELLTPRIRIATPSPSKPKRVARVVADIAQQLAWRGPIGIGFPAPIRDGVTLLAANVHHKWTGLDAKSLFNNMIGLPCYVLNDADAAGLAEMKFGAGRGRQGTVMIITIGTGLGTALFTDGYMVPNAEFGHLEINCEDAEYRASDAARKREKLSWKRWGKRFDRFLRRLELYLRPDLFILGGGISKKADKFMPYLTVEAEVVTAQLLNNAGIVGAALAVEQIGLVGEVVDSGEETD